MMYKSGFTLIEIMVVVVILGLLATLIAPRILSAPDKARVVAAQNDIRAIGSALKLYRLDNGFYPSQEQGLMALIEAPANEPVPQAYSPGGYLEQKTYPKDPWGTDYIYHIPAASGADFEVISLGADKKEGGTGYDADIVGP